MFLLGPAISVVILTIGGFVHETVEAQPQIVTTHGTVEGFTQTVLDVEVDTYLGIPFATPPVGNLRFKRPVDVQQWNETLHVKTPHNSCYTFIDTSFDRRPGVEMWNPNTNMSEDCLYLNIWVPRGNSSNSTTPMATMIWIFGGGFFAGTPTLEVYDGKYLAAHSDVIVASINYRTGPLGFLYMGTQAAPGNMGLLDQQLALRWIFRNIELFGGDKSRITLFGESAGAASAGYHSLSSGSFDFFNRSIMMSSAVPVYWTLTSNDTAESRARDFALFFKCPVNDKDAMLECLMSKSPVELSDNQFAVSVTGFLGVPFPPVVDGEFLTDDPDSLFKRDEYKKVDVLLGVVKDEGSYWLIYGLPQYFALVNNRSLNYSEFVTAIDSLLPEANDNVKKAVIALYAESTPSEFRNYRDIMDDIMGDQTFKCPVMQYAHIAAQSSKVYLYSFEERMSNLPWPEWMGVPHGYEVEVVFGLPLNESLGYTSAEVDFSKRVMTYWSNFAKTGDPNSATVANWPVYTDSRQEYAILDNTTQDYIQTGLRAQQCNFWSSIVPLLKPGKYKMTFS
ncbi:hypothetical protein LOTGIDRAFT_113227 [Lottia gigantea]|uniref:Carboxylic ester hydrolase n=1 Tax=Lottia gigantea TaxID=225164 RepID=V4CDP0_LOTGI|nr:hypothetical protein LOTGIDRAFT_113227 [Lottia gigantea]ESP00050.1 hypothetical protein LOTGIDRAFT_113227 [Lottia gigantea]